MEEASSTHGIRQDCIKFLYKTKPESETYLVDHPGLCIQEDNIKITLISRTGHTKSV